MFKSKWNIVLVLAACALLLPATVSAKKPVERPLKIQSDATVVGTSDFSSIVVTETGEATHLGRFSSLGNATVSYYDPDTGEYTLHYFTDWTAANGDVLKLEGFVDSATGPDPNKTYFTMEFWCISGSTGRFVGATGGFGDGIEVYSGDSVYDPETETTTTTFSYRVTGTITY